jgi:hypothetical protein
LPFSPLTHGDWTPVDGSICTTADVPGANGTPRNSVTSSSPSAYPIPVGTASTTGPPTAGKSGFGIVGKVASGEQKGSTVSRRVHD